MRYRDNTPLVLDGLNLVIQSGQTVGIVGRTGSGEDQLCLRFFQVVFFAFLLGVLAATPEGGVCVCVCVALAGFFPLKSSLL